MERRLEVAAVRRMMAAVGISVAVFVAWAGTVHAQTGTTVTTTGVETTTTTTALAGTTDDTGALPATGGGLLAGAGAGAGFLALSTITRRFVRR